METLSVLYKSPLWTSSPPKKLYKHHIILKKGKDELNMLIDMLKLMFSGH